MTDTTTNPSAPLTPSQVDAMGNRADALRAALPTQFGKEATRLTLARDQHARKAWSAEQEARAAEQQAAREQAVLDDLRAEIEQTTQRIQALLREGDLTAEDEASEHLAMLKQQAATAAARHGHAAETALRLRSEAAAADGKVTELDEAIEVNRLRAERAEVAIDALEAKHTALVMSEIALEEGRKAMNDWFRAVDEGRDEDAEALQRVQRDAFLRAEAHRAEADAITIDEVALGYVPVETSPEDAATPSAADDDPLGAAAVDHEDPDRELTQDELDDLFVDDDEIDHEDPDRELTQDELDDLFVDEGEIDHEDRDRELTQDELDDLFVDEGEVDAGAEVDLAPIEPVVELEAPPALEPEDAPVLEVDTEVPEVDLSDGLSADELPLG